MSEQAVANPPITESAFLQREAADAKAALKRSLDELKSQVAAGVDPRGWVEDHPWLTLSGVAVASFLATSAAVPSKEQQALRKLAEVEAALHPKAPESAKRNGHAEEKPPRSFLAMILMELLNVLKPMIAEVARNLVHPPADPKQQPPQSQSDQPNPT